MMARHIRTSNFKVRRRRTSSTASITDSFTFILSSRYETESLGHAIGRVLGGGEVLALIGDLGTGKTTLVRGLAAGLHAPRSTVSSPTFVFIHEYRGRLPLVHVDFYRLHSEAEAESIGLTEYFTDRAIVAVEWADRFQALLPEDRLEVRLSHRSPSTRTVRLTGHGPRSRALLTRVRHAPFSTRSSTAAAQRKTGGQRKVLH